MEVLVRIINEFYLRIKGFIRRSISVSFIINKLKKLKETVLSTFHQNNKWPHLAQIVPYLSPASMLNNPSALPVSKWCNSNSQLLSQASPRVHQWCSHLLASVVTRFRTCPLSFPDSARHRASRQYQRLSRAAASNRIRLLSIPKFKFPCLRPCLSSRDARTSCHRRHSILSPLTTLSAGNSPLWTSRLVPLTTWRAAGNSLLRCARLSNILSAWWALPTTHHWRWEVTRKVSLMAHRLHALWALLLPPRAATTACTHQKTKAVLMKISTLLLCIKCNWCAPSLSDQIRPSVVLRTRMETATLGRRRSRPSFASSGCKVCPARTSRRTKVADSRTDRMNFRRRRVSADSIWHRSARTSWNTHPNAHTVNDASSSTQHTMWRHDRVTQKWCKITQGTRQCACSRTSRAVTPSTSIRTRRPPLACQLSDRSAAALRTTERTTLTRLMRRK